MEENTQTTLHDQIASQFDALEEAQTKETPPASTEVVSPSKDVTTTETAGTLDGDKPGRTAGRARDDQGRLLPGKAEIPPQVAEAAKPGVVSATSLPATEPRPSSWKKEMWGEFDKIPPNVQQYINQRESEFARGVSTYKQEWETARPVMEALTPHLPLLQQHGIDPGQQVARYMQVHKTLALGSPQDKLGLFAQMAKDYQVPLEQLFVRGQDGQIYLNNQLPTPQVQQPQQDVAKIVETKLIEREAQQAAKTFTEAKDAAGNPVHPHFETVRDTMRQLLEAGIAQDLDSAYDAALRLPAHFHLYEQQQQQLTAKDEAEKQKKLAEQAGLARRNAVSPRSATPVGKTTETAKGIRGALEEAFDAHMPGRV